MQFEPKQEANDSEILWESSIFTTSQLGLSLQDGHQSEGYLVLRLRSSHDLSLSSVQPIRKAPAKHSVISRVIALFATRSPSRNEIVGCLICQDNFEDRACFNTPCGHYFCPECIVTMAKAAITEGNEELFPLRCCNIPLPLKKLLESLPKPLRAPVVAKSTEMSVPSSLRLYCPNDTCFAFLGRSPRKKTTVSCPNCHAKVCSACKQTSHSPKPCGALQETASEVVLSREAMELVSGKGWKVCPGCKVIVERKDGCSHMRCRCGTEFCYQCGDNYNRCSC